MPLAAAMSSGVGRVDGFDGIPHIVAFTTRGALAPDYPGGMPKHLFSQVDVFSAEPMRGNPVAVVHDAVTQDGHDLATEQMQAFARWTNLSETTFVLPPRDAAADYRLRIFTPGGELPFAGHPTLGSCRAWLAVGGVPADTGVIVQDRKSTRLNSSHPG